MSGHLRRRLKNNKWKRSWFVLKERVLYIYRASEDTIAAETLPVLGWTLQPLAEVNITLRVPLLSSRILQPLTEIDISQGTLFSSENPKKCRNIFYSFWFVLESFWKKFHKNLSFPNVKIINTSHLLF